MTCTMTRPLASPLGWVCTGEDLTSVMRMGDGLPIVVPTALLDRVRAQGGAPIDPQPFEGGEHLHFPIWPEPADAVREVVKAWHSVGYERRQVREASAHLRRCWPELAKALDTLAKVTPGS